MALTVYCGPPGSGKSYALVSQVIVPAVMAGRRVLTNVAGVKPDEVVRYCRENGNDPYNVGSVHLFDGLDSLGRGFWPTQDIPDTETTVKGGDLVVFDEWKLYFPRRGKLPTPDLEPFLRWHRHLTNEAGTACDVAIGTQLATDVHGDFRGLIERSYKFRKLKAVGLDRGYRWEAFEGHLQPKGGGYQVGNGVFKAEIFALYSSYAGGNGSELGTDKRASVWSKWLILAGLGVVGLVGGGLYGAFAFFGPGEAEAVPVPVPSGQPVAGGAAAPISPGQGGPVVSASRWRIVGSFLGDQGVRVVLASSDGVVRQARPDAFLFDQGRPVSGTFEGEQVRADEQFQIAPAAPLGMVP